MTLLRLPLLFALYLVYRVIRAYKGKEIMLHHGQDAWQLYQQMTPGTFAAFRGSNG